VGDSLSFSLSFQQPSADFAPDDPTFGPYDLGSGTFTLNGGQFTTPIAKSRAQILNTAGGPFLIADELALVGNPLGEALPSRIGVGLSGDDFIGNWLTTDQWPADVAATLIAAPSSRLWLFDRNAEHGTFATLGNLELTQVPKTPEPTTIGLVGAGLVGLGARRWRQRKA
jgi:hypothetical protein